MNYPDEELRLTREDLAGLTLKAAREVCQPVLAHMETVDRKAAKQAKTTPFTGKPAPTAKQIKRVKKEYVSSARSVAKDLKTGTLSPSSARHQVWSRADIKIREKQLPDFGVAIKQVRRQIQSWHNEDFTDKVKELCAAAKHIQDEDDRAEYGYAARDLRDVIDRCDRSAKRFEKAASGPASVHHLKEVEKA
jgi:hypothetical protein